MEFVGVIDDDCVVIEAEERTEEDVVVLEIDGTDDEVDEF